MANVMRAMCMVMQLNLSSVRCLGLRRSIRFPVDMGVSSGLCMTNVISEHQIGDKPTFVDANLASLSEDVAVIGEHVARRSTRFWFWSVSRNVFWATDGRHFVLESVCCRARVSLL